MSKSKPAGPSAQIYLHHHPLSAAISKLKFFWQDVFGVNSP